MINTSSHKNTADLSSNLFTYKIFLVAKSACLLFMILFSSRISIYSQSLSRPEIMVAFITAKCVDTTYTKVHTRERHYSDYYIKDKLVYEVSITLKLSGEGFVYNRPIDLTCFLPGDLSVSTLLNIDGYELTPDKFHEYQFYAAVKTKGLAKIVLKEWDPQNQFAVENSKIKFIDASFFLD